MKAEKDYDSFVLGYVNTPSGFMGCIDCMREGEDEFDRVLLVPRTFETKKEVQKFLNEIAVGMQKEFGSKTTLVV